MGEQGPWCSRSHPSLCPGAGPGLGCPTLAWDGAELSSHPGCPAPGHCLWPGACLAGGGALGRWQGPGEGKASGSQRPGEVSQGPVCAFHSSEKEQCPRTGPRLPAPVPSLQWAFHGTLGCPSAPAMSPQPGRVGLPPRERGPLSRGLSPTHDPLGLQWEMGGGAGRVAGCPGLQVPSAGRYQLIPLGLGPHSPVMLLMGWRFCIALYWGPLSRAPGCRPALCSLHTPSSAAPMGAGCGGAWRWCTEGGNLPALRVWGGACPGVSAHVTS